MDQENRAELRYIEKCTACRACLVQCPEDAIRAEPVQSGSRSESRSRRAGGIR